MPVRRSKTVEWLTARLYKPDRPWDVKLRFIDTVRGYVEPSAHVLDLGAGSGWNPKYDYGLRGECQKIVGLDLGIDVKDNPRLDEAIVGDITAIPIADSVFDVVLSMTVLEHVRDPGPCTTEIRRILKPGGHFLTIIPSRYHYVALVARTTPHWFHEWFGHRMWGQQRESYPTYYKLNTIGSLRRAFESAGFETVSVRGHEPIPNYLAFSAPTFLLGAAHERIVHSTDILSSFRASIVGIFRKPCSEGTKEQCDPGAGEA